MFINILLPPFIWDFLEGGIFPPRLSFLLNTKKKMMAIKATIKIAAKAIAMYCPVWFPLEDCGLDIEWLLGGGEFGFEWELGGVVCEDCGGGWFCGGGGWFCGGGGLMWEEGEGMDGAWGDGGDGGGDWGCDGEGGGGGELTSGGGGDGDGGDDDGGGGDDNGVGGGDDRWGGGGETFGGGGGECGGGACCCGGGGDGDGGGGGGWEGEGGGGGGGECGGGANGGEGGGFDGAFSGESESSNVGINDEDGDGAEAFSEWEDELLDLFSSAISESIKNLNLIYSQKWLENLKTIK